MSKFTGISQKEASHQDGSKVDFVKGMTLQEYMSKAFSEYTTQQDLYDNQNEQNFEQARISHHFEGLTKNTEYMINQIGQESLEDSNLSILSKKTIIQSKKEQKKQTLIKSKEIYLIMPQQVFSQKIMNKTAAFKKSSKQTNYRINKPHQFSPNNKKNNSSTKGNNLITLERNIKETVVKESYKKLKVIDNTRLTTNILNLTPLKRMLKDVNSKKQIKKKYQLQIKDLIQFQSQIRSNYSQNGHYPDLKIEGVNKDKAVNRKIKF